MIRSYWNGIGGTLVEEFQIVARTDSCARRLVDAIILRDGPRTISRLRQVDLAGRDVVVIQAKAHRLGMYLMGQAVFSAELVRRRFSPSRLKSVILCRADDSELRLLLERRLSLLEVTPESASSRHVGAPLAGALLGPSSVGTRIVRGSAGGHKGRPYTESRPHEPRSSTNPDRLSLRTPPTVDLASVPDPQDEIARLRPCVDYAVIADADPEEAGELAGERLSGSALPGQGLLDFPENSKRHSTVEPIEVSGNRGLVLNACGGQSAFSSRPRKRSDRPCP